MSAQAAGALPSLQNGRFKVSAVRQAAQERVDGIDRELNLAFEEVRRLDKERAQAQRELNDVIQREGGEVEQ